MMGDLARLIEAHQVSVVNFLPGWLQMLTEVPGSLESLRVDVAFIGANGISVRHGLSTPDPDEAAVKRAMVECANFVVVVADSSKIGHEDFVRFAPVERVDVLVTDAEITDRDRAGLAECGVEVVVAGESS